MKQQRFICPPTSNRGVPDTVAVLPKNSVAATIEKYTQIFIDSKGQILEVPMRRGVADSAFIDAISFTFHEDTLNRGVGLVSDDDFVAAISLQLQTIFGFGISFQANGTGNRFYERCYILGDYETMYGRVHHGGQNDTMLVEILGTGCQAAADNWEGRLYDFLTHAIRPKIRRLDVSKDFLHGEYSPESAKSDWESGLYDKRGKRPIAECIGCDWISNTQKGKTFAVGSRQSSCYIRIYDKAKQMGDVHQQFCRAECEFKGKYCLIPFEALLSPGEFFGGAAEALSLFATVATSRVMGSKRMLETSIEKVEEVAKQQCGRAINMLLDLGNSAEQIIEKLKAPAGLLPKRVRPEQFSHVFNLFVPIHERMADRLDIDEFGMCFEP